MNVKHLLSSFIIFFLFSATFFFFPTPAHANILTDLTSKIKGLFFSEERKLKIDSQIAFAPQGDSNKNGEMDGGDVIRFSFAISNETDTTYPFTKLKTNIKRDWIHFIHNLQGITGIDNKTLELPNMYIPARTTITVSFDAKLNYGTKPNQEISSQGLLYDKKAQKLAEGIKKMKKIKASKKQIDESMTKTKP